jgi:tetratricopeptide (TPR) repeat protein
MPSVSAPRPFSPVLAAAMLVAAILGCYANSLRGPFVFDDTKSITENSSIRRFWSWQIFSPPATATVAGRPLVNASLALNHAVDGENVRGYHALNVAIHAGAALTLFGLLRRTWQRREPPGATMMAFAATLLWAVHPLQTESVTYVVQRAESLMGLFYLLTLYAFVRSVDAERHGTKWQCASVLACALGMACKEVMVTAPLVTVLFDRWFVADTWCAVARRRGYYAALASTWVLLAALSWHAGDRAGTAGFSAGATVSGYALTQCGAILHYLRLSVWPHPLIFDYGPYVAPDALRAAIAVVGVTTLGGLTLWLARRRPSVAFGAAAFLLVLAPTSSVLPIVTEPIAEHRLYLPLAVIAAGAGAGFLSLGGRRGIALASALAMAFGWLTIERNRDYATEHALWASTVAAAPDNPRAHYSLALTLADAGDGAGVERHLQRALALRPDYVGARHAYATWLSGAARSADAARQYEAILGVQPDDFAAHNNLGMILFQSGNLTAAAAQFTAAGQLKPGSAEVHNNLACVHYELGHWPEAQREAEEAARLQPDYPAAHYNLGNALARQRRLADARRCYERALALDPNYVEAHVNLAAVLEPLGERTAAIEHYRAALRLQPGQAFSQQHLDALLAPQR